MYNIIVTSIASGINVSIVYSIYGSSSIFAAIVFYFVYNEQLSMKHALGIVIMTISIVLIANGRYQPSQETKDRLGIVKESDHVSVLVPITLAILNCWVFVFNSAIVREVNKTKISIN